MIFKHSELIWKILVLKGWLVASLITAFAERTPIECVESWGGSWSFDGFNDGINIGMDDNVEFLGGFTVDLRFRYSRRQPNSELFHLKLGGTVMSAYLLPGTYDMAVDFLGPDNSLYRHQFPFPGVSDKWHHLTICLSKSTPAKVYFDGKTVQSETDIETQISEIPTNHLHLGGTDNTDNSRFAGDIDAVRVWNRMLGEKDLESIGIKNHLGISPQLLVAWTFETRDLSRFATTFQVETKGNPIWIPPQSFTPQNVILHGNITNDEGIPLPMQRVELRSTLKNFPRMMTDPDGNFVRMIEREQQHLTIVTHDQNNRAISSPTDITESSPSLLDLSQSVSTAPVIEGFIRAKDEETPISGVEVMLESLDKPETVGPVSSFSDLSGRYQFSGIPAGEFRIAPKPSNWSLFPDENIFFENTQLSQKIRINSTTTRIDFNIVPTKLGRWRHFGMKDSLPLNNFEFIEISADQSLWTGNKTQLYQYEGNLFQRIALELTSQETIADIATFSLSSCIVALSNGRILIVDKSGITHEFSSPKHATIQSILLTFENELFLATNDGIFHTDLIPTDTKAKPQWRLLSPIRTNHLAYTPNHELWAGSPSGAIKVHGKFEERIQEDSGLEDAFVNSVILSGDGRAVFIQTAHRIYKRKGEKFQLINLPARFEFNVITCLDARSENDLWIGTQKDGLWRMSSDKWTRYSMADGLPSNRIASLKSDEYGNLWVGTFNGLSRHNDKHWITIAPPMGMPTTQVFSLSFNPVSKTLFAGTEWSGVVQLEAAGIGYHALPEFARNQLYEEGKPLVILGNHLAIEHPTSGDFQEVIRDLPYSSWLLTGDMDPSGNLWLGRQWSGGGLIKMRWPSPSSKLPEFEEMWTEADGLGNANIWSIWAESADRVWVGTEKGIFIKSPEKWIPVPHQIPDRNYQAIHILPTASGDVWVGTEKGIGRIENGKFIPYITNTLLDETLVWTLHQDSNGKIRVGTNAYGMYILQDGMINHLTVESGLSGNSIYDILEQPNGVFWIANEYGIDRHIAHKHPLKVYFESIRGDHNYDPNNRLPDFNMHSRLIFDVRTSDITSSERKSNYRVKIMHASGKESKPHTIRFTEDRLEWVPTEKGDYTLELVAFDQNLYPSEPAILKLKVIPPWYLNWTITAPLSLGMSVGLIWISALLLKGFRLRKESRQLKAELLSQEIKVRQHLETVNENLRDAKQQALDAKKDAEQASEAKSLFLAKMSHEIRTPLNAVLGYSQVLKGNKTLDDQTLTGLSAIENSGQHLLEIINDILTLSKIESGHVKIQQHDFALTELLDSISEMVSLNCKKKGLKCRIQCTEWLSDQKTGKYVMKELAIKPPWPRIAFHGDIAKVRQILLNLITNAIKFTHEGSITLELRIQHPTLGDNPDKATSEPLEVYFAVTDTGLGMEQDDIQRVFGAFEQGTSKGSGEFQGIGLGLSIARRMVEVLGGKLLCQSQPNKGSRFYFTLPMVQAKYRPFLGPVSKLRPKWKGTPPVALIVDDLEQNSIVLIRLLNLLNIRSESVSSGQEALEFLQKRKIDIIFMDIMMPKMTGIEAFEQIRNQLGLNAPKCVAYSAHVFEHEKEAYNRALFDGLLAKPIELDELIQIIFELFSDRIVSEQKVDQGQNNLKDIYKLTNVIKEQLINAAERYAVTELMRQIDHLQNSETLSQETCQFLKSLARSGDMKKLIQVLQ